MTPLQTNCPKCNSEKTQSFPMAYRSGTSSGRIVGVGLDVDGDLGFGHGMTSSQTHVAKLTSPPASKGDGEMLGIIAIVLVVPILVLIAGTAIFSIGLSIVMTLVAFVAVAAFGYLRWKTKLPALQDAHRAAMLRWEQSWLCLKCGHRFYIRS